MRGRESDALSRRALQLGGDLSPSLSLSLSLSPAARVASSFAFPDLTTGIISPAREFVAIFAPEFLMIFNQADAAARSLPSPSPFLSLPAFIAAIPPLPSF